jgi:hypothetical protein
VFPGLRARLSKARAKWQGRGKLSHAQADDAENATIAYITVVADATLVSEPTVGFRQDVIK